MFNNSDKLRAIGLSLWFGLVLIIKQFFGKIGYPIAYLAKDWVYADDKIENYIMPDGVKKSKIKWLLWLFLDDDQPTGYPEWYAVELLGYEPVTTWEKFRCAYSWSAWRNPMYNVNYNYLSKPSTITGVDMVFGKYEWNRKLRASNGDDGVQFVWMTREDGRTTYLFSLAKTFIKIPLTIFYGWNADANGRFTVAFKFK